VSTLALLFGLPHDIPDAGVGHSSPEGLGHDLLQAVGLIDYEVPPLDIEDVAVGSRVRQQQSVIHHQDVCFLCSVTVCVVEAAFSERTGIRGAVLTVRSHLQPGRDRQAEVQVFPVAGGGHGGPAVEVCEELPFQDRPCPQSVLMALGAEEVGPSLHDRVGGALLFRVAHQSRRRGPDGRDVFRKQLALQRDCGRRDNHPLPHPGSPEDGRRYVADRLAGTRGSVAQQNPFLRKRPLHRAGELDLLGTPGVVRLLSGERSVPGEEVRKKGVRSSGVGSHAQLNCTGLRELATDRSLLPLRPLFGREPKSCLTPGA
jgi:hypothetical protein